MALQLEESVGAACMLRLLLDPDAPTSSRAARLCDVRGVVRSAAPHAPDATSNWAPSGDLGRREPRLRVCVGAGRNDEAMAATRPRSGPGEGT